MQKILPVVQTAAAFNDPVPLTEAVKSLLRFVIRVTGATDGALIVRHASTDGTESTAAYDASGQPLPAVTVPFGRSLAASVVSLQEPVSLNALDPATLGPTELTAFETGRSSILAAPLPVDTGTVVVLELFDKPAPGFTEADRRLVAAAADVGADLLRQAFAERQTHQLLFDAVEAALQATSGVTDVLAATSTRARPRL